MVVDHRRTLTRLATTLNLERRNRFMKSKLFRFLSLVVITAITLGASPAHATRIRVVTTLTDLADLTRNVGGEHVEIHSLATGIEDTHGVPMKPSFVPVLNRADLVVLVGFDCEHAFLPALLEASKIRASRAANPITWIVRKASRRLMCQSPPTIPRATCIPTATPTTCSIRCWPGPRCRTSATRWLPSRRNTKPTSSTTATPTSPSSTPRSRNGKRRPRRSKV